MKNLIIGPSGVGKTTLARELQLQGEIAYDADLVPNLGSWLDGAGTVHEYQNDPAWRSAHNYLWSHNVMRQLLASHSPGQDLHVLGIASNTRDFFDYFDNVFTLDASPVTIRSRSEHPSRNTAFPYTFAEENERWLYEIQPQVRALYIELGAIAIDAEPTPAEIANNILGYVRRTA